MPDEHDLIARFFRPLAQHPAALSLIDDAAVYAPPPGRDLVITKDALVAGVHFFPNDPPETIAKKSLRVNLSDLAAKGAKPEGFLLALALPAEIDEPWLAAFADGLKQDIDMSGCALFGGDTVSTPGPVTISITAFGSVPSGTMVKRSGANPSDRIFVSGTIGDAALALHLRRNNDEAKHPGLRERYLLPQPRMALAEAVREHATASMDVSDGLAGDLAKLCKASSVSAKIEIANVPLSPSGRTLIDNDARLLETALTGGDDYEILCTVPESRAESFMQAAAKAGVAVTGIGNITRAVGDPPVFVDATGKPMAFARMSFSHF